ncbi:ADL117Wp [Eremothecium gossypii ATCC 10895]|uniref:Small ribosomal subunit protein bS18m n=1 Tax=Eremothecium gossypii (strain ATCC 10895 / CBS 109.51 / FGSC 9923 / NRRL Y-1056) TaxID=284811 RepID=Q75AN9_EREGS|nr:mitochondrial 37S ribosomal protein RSM18 [Eremothecium gossypii ATCC 10895]AAS51803.1 ADL117Wp [Eremothecium gossypii ATCC 10895]AEY96101.1 FADL117Wp [Eremothecium gossypii FDAG1]
MQTGCCGCILKKEAMLSSVRSGLLLSSSRAFSKCSRTLVAQQDLGLLGSAPKNDQVKKVPPEMMKKFATGSLYDPFDFSMARLHLEKKHRKNARKVDIFEELNLDPLDLYTSPAILSRFVGNTGKILHRDVTGLSVRSQKRMSRAVRRCQAIGLMSKTHKDVSLLSHSVMSER